MSEKPITYRLVRELYESCNDRGAMNLSLDLCSAEQFSIHVGPHPGFDEPRSLVVGVKFFGADPTYLELAFSPEDDLPARQLAEALTAWADWIESTTDQETKSPQIDERREAALREFG